jgi:uncharacterized membrane protein YgdD (TMEM256/DUF423 family)
MSLIGLVAAIAAAIAVAAGAFGAHGASSAEAKSWLQTGGQYQLVHAVAAIALLAVLPGARWAAWCFLIGGAVFAGTLYVMALGGPRWLGAITPIGGSLLILGWVSAAVAFARS